MNRFVPAGLMLSLLTACGGSDNDRAQQIQDELDSRGINADVSVTIDPETGEENVVLENVGRAGVTAGKNIGRPDTLPDDIPLPGTLTVNTSAPIPGGGIVSGISSEAGGALAGWFEAEMTANGWSLDQTSQQGQMHSLTFSKPQRRASITMLPTPGGSSVQISTMRTGS